MLFRSAIVGRGHGIEDEGARRQVDGGSPGNAERIDVTAWEVGTSDRGSNVPLPDDAPVGGIERINVVGLGRHNDHGPISRTAFDVERLSIDVAGNDAGKVGIPSQAGGSARREGRL